MAIESPSNSGGALDKDDILDILKDDTLVEGDETNKEDKEDKVDKKPVKAADDLVDEDEDEDEDKDADDDEKEDDDEDRIGDKEDDKVLELDERAFPRKREILKAYPDLFKKFPTIEAAIYRDRQFSEVFPTPEDAKDAQVKAEQLDDLSESLAAGNSEQILKQIAENDQTAFYRVVDGLLDGVAKVDQKAYHHILGNVVKFTIMAMAEEARVNKDEELMEHAAALNKFVFRSEKFEPPKRLVNNQDNPERRQVNDERVALNQERFETARETLQTRVDNSIKAAIDTYIDPKSEMSKFVKTHAARNAFDQLENALANDRSLRATLDRLWRSAAEAKYSSSSLDKIRTAYLSKAKTVLRDVIKGARVEALKGSRRSASNDDRRDRRGPIPVGRASGSHSSNNKKEVPKGMSNKDFIMSD